jgi:cell division transport system permease protein
MRSIPFLFREAIVNLRRHGLMTAAAVTTIAVALALMSSFAITFYQVNTATRRAVGEFEMRVFCREEVNKKQVAGIRKRIEGIPGVAKPVVYISKEKAFKEWTRDQPIDTTDIPNKFNETFVIKMADAKRAPEIARQIRGWHDLIQEVSLPEDEMGGVMSIANFLRVVGAGGGIILLFSALVVVSNTVRISLFSRRREIRIMQIVGATPWFIRLPLFLEGLIHGVVGGLIASGCLILTTRYVNGLIVQTIPQMARYFDIALSMRTVSLALIGVGALIGAGGSLLSMRRYLKTV